MQKTSDTLALLLRKTAGILTERSSLHSTDRPCDEFNESRRLCFGLYLLRLLKARGFVEADACRPSRKELQRIYRDVAALIPSVFFAPQLFDHFSLTDAEAEEFLKGIDEHLGDTASASIGMTYERLLPSGNLNQSGVFYTPRPIVEMMVKQCLSPLLSKKKAVTVLDPACGGGAFLLGAFEFLRDRSRARHGADSGREREILSTGIFGVDRDPWAVEVAKVSLQIEFLSGFKVEKRPELPPNLAIYCGDSLISPDDLDDPSAQRTLFAPDMKGFDWREAFPAVFADRSAPGFTAVIGNPPYGLSRDDQLSAEENKVLQRIYASSRVGKVNKYLLFLARGYELLNDDGRLCFIVPNSWLGIRGGRALRDQFLESGVLESIQHFSSKVFALPSVEPVVVQLRKGPPIDEIKIEKLNDAVTCTQEEVFALPRTACLTAPDHIIPLRWSAGVQEVLEHLDRSCITLGSDESSYVPLIALQAYAVGKGTPPQTADDLARRVYDCRTAEAAAIPYLEGSDVGRYRIAWSGSYLKYGPWLAEFQPVERFTGARVLVREILDKPPYSIFAAATEERFLYNRSILHIILKPDIAPEYAWALLGILNSRIGSFLINYRGRKSQRRLFPKIVNDDLKSFLLPKNLASAVAFIAPLARKMMKAPENAALQEQLDLTVSSAYELTQRYRAVIDR